MSDDDGTPPAVRSVLKFFDPQPSLQPELSVFGKLYLFLEKVVTPNTRRFLVSPTEESADEFAPIPADPDLSLRQSVLADRLVRGIDKVLTSLRL